MIAIGRLSRRSRRIEPPTAETAPRKIGHHLDTHRQGFGGSDGPEQADGQGVEDRDEFRHPVEHALEQHAEKRGDQRHRQVPVVLESCRHPGEKHVAQESATEPGGDTDDRDPEQVEPAITELRGEQRALHGSDADRE